MVEPETNEVISGSTEPRRAALGRAAMVITACNLASRITGFVRVIAVAGALGIAFLGDAYQRANEVSNVLFELLIGGLLFSVLVPSFVELLDRNPQDARRLGSVLATRGTVLVSLLAALGMIGGKWVMEILTLGVPEKVRAQQIALGSFLLWFIMPQLVFYALGAVASALLQADHRFLATSIAPLFNNVVVTITMVVFAAQHDPAAGFTLTHGDKLLLGAGTLAGTIAMTIVPFVALWNAKMSLRPKWSAKGLGLRSLVHRGAWAAGHVGLNEVLILVTIVLAGRVDGGVIAYKTAFMFFLLPHALLAYPIFTALFPRLSKRAAANDRAAFAADLRLGMRSIVTLLLPASGLLGAVAAPTLSLVQVGQLDNAGARLVAFVLCGYLVGLSAYSVFFLLTRASYAIGDAKSPTVVNLVATVVAIIAMVVGSAFVHGTSLLVLFGLFQAVALVGAVIVLSMIMRRWMNEGLGVIDAVARALGSALAGTVVALTLANLIGWQTRSQALLASVVSGGVGGIVVVCALWLLRSPEIVAVRDMLMRRVGKRGIPA